MIFDLFPRDLQVIKGAEELLVIYLRGSLDSQTKINDIIADPDGMRLDLLHRITPIEIVSFAPRISLGQAPLAVVELTQPRPYPLTASGLPPASVNPDGSYSFTPTVAGGFGPYTFELEGTLSSGLQFDTSTGTLSRPPE